MNSDEYIEFIIRKYNQIITLNNNLVISNNFIFNHKNFYEINEYIFKNYIKIRNNKYDYVHNDYNSIFCIDIINKNNYKEYLFPLINMCKNKSLIFIRFDSEIKNFINFINKNLLFFNYSFEFFDNYSYFCGEIKKCQKDGKKIEIY